MYGGNKVRQVNLGRYGVINFADDPYVYYFNRLDDGNALDVNELSSYAIFILRMKSDSKLIVNNEESKLAVGDLLLGQNSPCSIRVEGEVELLVAGVTECDADRAVVDCIAHSDLYKVRKPWGHELWINGEGMPYVLKQIFVKAGTKTSLQYHRMKRETNVLFEGTARLHYKNNDQIDNDSVTSDHVESVEIQPVTVIDISPPTIHRLEAITDILLYEVSTPHLDDVIRVQDDTRRKDGRIISEHIPA